MIMTVMGDPHSHPDYDNDRFERAGRHMLDQGTDVFVCTGDWFDYASLCKHSSRQSRENARVDEETAHGVDAVRRLVAPFKAEAKRRKRHFLSVAPEMVLIEGNHDVRPDLLAGDDPALEGAVAKDRYDAFREHDIRVVPFKEVVVIGGIAFCHYMASGTMGRPVGGSSSSLLARSLITKGFMSTIVGHDHRYGHSKAERWDGKKIHAWSAGCYVHHDYREGWCKQTEPMWDRGLLDIELRDGEVVSHRWTREDVLRGRYG
jgi:hypothetical protein